MSTLSRELRVIGSVFIIAVIAGSCYLTKNQEALVASFKFFLDKAALHHEQVTVESAPEGGVYRKTLSLGRWRVDGPYIVDESGTPVRLTGINWSGFETSTKVLGGLDQQDYRVVLDSIHKAGFNIIRIPFSNEMVEHPSQSPSVSFKVSGRAINQDLINLNSLEIMDKVLVYSARIGLRVILDNHRSTAGGGPQENGLWFTEDFPETSWIDDWLFLARRYKRQPALLGFDLRNEPHSVGGAGACWSCGGATDWHLAAERVGNALLAEDPSKLIIVEGVDKYGEDTSWWGGNLQGVTDAPVRLTLPHHVVYSPHEYGPEEHSQPWFNSRTTSSSLQLLWQRRWGYIQEQGLAPIYVGEFGTRLDSSKVESVAGSQAQWFSAFLHYLAERPEIGWSYWSANAEDRYSIFEPDYRTERGGFLPLRTLIARDRDLSAGFTGSDSPSRSSPICLHDASDGGGACGSLPPSEPKKTRDRQEGQNSYIAESVSRATENAIRTLPEPALLENKDAK